MFLNVLNSNKSFNNIVQKKVFSQFIYDKLFIRSFLQSEKSFYIIENNSNFLILSKTESNKLFLSLQVNRVGMSCIFTSFLFKHKLDDTYRFNSFLPQVSLSKYNFYSSSKQLQEIIKFRNKKSLKFCFFIILKPIKAGFKGFSSGMRSFIFTNNILYIIKNILRPFYYFKGIRQSIPSLSFWTTKTNFFKNYFVLRFPFKLRRLRTYTLRKKRKKFKMNFRFKKTFLKKQTPKKILNYVFLRKKFVRQKVTTSMFYDFIMSNKHIFLKNFYVPEGQSVEESEIIYINKLLYLKIRRLLKNFFEKRKFTR